MDGGAQAMVSVMKSNTKYKLLILLCCVIAARLLYLQLTEKKELIMTPSTHRQVVFLETNNERLTSKYKVYFCLYDPECNYIQVCIKIPRDDQTLWSHPDRLAFSIDGEEPQGYAHATTATWKGNYFMILLDEVPEFEKFELTYEGKTCEAYFGDK